MTLVKFDYDWVDFWKTLLFFVDFDNLRLYDLFQDIFPELFTVKGNLRASFKKDNFLLKIFHIYILPDKNNS